jgi:hypothetical protein
MHLIFFFIAALYSLTERPLTKVVSPAALYSKCTDFVFFIVALYSKCTKALTFEKRVTHTHTHTHTRTGSKYTVHVPEILRTSSSSSPSSLVHVQPSRSGEPAPVGMRRSQQQPAPLSLISSCGNTGNTCEHEQQHAPHTRISATAASPMENTCYREHIPYAQQLHAPPPRISATAAATAASPAHPGAPDAPYLRAPYLRAVTAEEAAAGTAAVAAAVATAKAVSQMRHMPGYTSHLKRRCAQVDAAS